jgi:hypothetical protein
MIVLIASVFFYKIYMLRVNAFGCFDDCFNIIGGYWLTKGKVIYTDFFFNHNPGMAYLSYWIQHLFHPINIYELILRHRQSIFLFGFVANCLLVLRFRWPALGWILLYECTKYYAFGDRFLAEGVIVYPLVYLIGIAWYLYHQKKVYRVDCVAIVLATWLVMVMREPYIPLVVVLFAAIVLLVTEHAAVLPIAGLFVQYLYH